MSLAPDAAHTGKWAARAVSRALVLAAACGGTAFAQSDHAFVGKWQLQWEGSRDARIATLVIEPSGGTWYGNNVSKKNPCIGKSAPLEIESVTAQKIAVRAKLSEVQPGCNDSRVVITREADGSYSATHAKQEAKIVRQR